MIENVWDGQEQKRLDFANKILSERPESLRRDRVNDIVNGKITVGMTPWEAKLAGGAFTYKVIPDPTLWEKDIDPLRVIWAQSDHPDNSQIIMKFTNKTQFSNNNPVHFLVQFNNGMAVNIEEIK